MESPQDTLATRPGLFLVSALPPLLWLVLLFFVPLFLIWGYSFGEKRGLIEIEVVWTLQNYADALEPAYVKIFFRTLVYTVITTAFCLLIGFPVALVVAFADEKWETLSSVVDCLALLDEFADPHLCPDSDFGAQRHNQRGIRKTPRLP